MIAFPGLNGRVNGGSKLRQVEEQDSDKVRKISVAHGLLIKDDGYGPPKCESVDGQQGKLGKQGLRTMPANKKRPVPVSKVEDQRGNQVNDGQW